jgi:phosphoribosylanthranilate isomerase
MKVKVCGMRDPENILALAKLPVDMMGFIFYPKSPRSVKDKKLPAWLNKNADALKKIKRVGVFVNAEIEEVLNKVHDYQLDFVQLHGDESPEYCEELLQYWEISTMRRAKLIKAFPVDEYFNFVATAGYAGHCALFLFDTKGVAFGGTGKAFNWELLRKYKGPRPFLLAGGIGPESIDSIRVFSHELFYGVDLNSRFEKGPGIKDLDKIQLFFSQENV